MRKLMICLAVGLEIGAIAAVFLLHRVVTDGNDASTLNKLAYDLKVPFTTWHMAEWAIRGAAT